MLDKRCAKVPILFCGRKSHLLQEVLVCVLWYNPETMLLVSSYLYPLVNKRLEDSHKL